MQCRLAEREDARDIHFYSSSGGNAGLACVCAAQALSFPATVVVPTSTKPMMIAKIQAGGADQVIQHGENWKAADTYLREVILAENPHGIYVPPFDHPDIWTGNSTLVLDSARQLEGQVPDVIVCSVGGGGLLNGVMQAVDQLGWTDTTVVAMETDGAQSLYKSVEAGEIVTLPRITSQATSLGATRVSTKTFEYAQRPCVKTAVLSDAEAALACVRLADEERIAVELACGVNVAVLLDGRLKRVLGKQLSPDSIVLIVLCGGGNVSVDMLAEWKRQFQAG